LIQPQEFLTQLLFTLFELGQLLLRRSTQLFELFGGSSATATLGETR
jgi:hypothetical protein